MPGFILGLVPQAIIAFPLSRNLIFTVFLPPLVLEAALVLKWENFSRNLPVTTLLALPGVVIAATAVAAGTCN